MIDETLNRFGDQIQADDGTALSKLDETYQAQALTAIYEIGLECIGADYPAEDLSKGKHTLYMIPAGKNDEKARMRKAWAKACGVAEW